jgi:RNA polymerase sigma-70 factor (family 1)
MEGPQEQSAETQWMELFREGNETALAYFFKLHHKALSYFANQILVDEAAAQEIVSDCFLKLWQKHSDFQKAHNIKAFLFISCRNACLNYLRQLKTRSAAQDRYITELETETTSSDYQVIETELLELVSTEINALPEKMKEVFKLLYLNGKSTSEVADELDLSVQTVRNQKTKAIELIKNSLLKKGISTAVYFAFLLFIEGK